MNYTVAALILSIIGVFAFFINSYYGDVVIGGCILLVLGIGAFFYLIKKIEGLEKNLGKIEDQK